MAIKTERVMLALITDEDGRKLAAGCSIDAGRDWEEVITDWCEAAMETKKALNYEALDPNFKVLRRE